jgi:hypothetical protein
MIDESFLEFHAFQRIIDSASKENTVFVQSPSPLTRKSCTNTAASVRKSGRTPVVEDEHQNSQLSTLKLMFVHAVLSHQ